MTIKERVEQKIKELERSHLDCLKVSCDIHSFPVSERISAHYKIEYIKGQIDSLKWVEAHTKPLESGH